MGDADVRLVRVEGSTLDTEHICCAIGSSAENKAYVASKKAWLADRFREGHRFLKADARGKVFIEYGPVEREWSPVLGESWSLIQCFWVSGRFKGLGLGSRLLDECEADSKREGRRGIACVVGAKKTPFLSDGAFLLARGYEVVDEALGGAVRLVAKRLGGRVEFPRFTDAARACSIPRSKGVRIWASPACPFAPSFAREMGETAESMGFSCKVEIIGSLESAKAVPSPFPILSAFLDGKLVASEPMPAEKWKKVLASAKA
jgi:GNAT superfamily N-acetyltransferase